MNEYTIKLNKNYQKHSYEISADIKYLNHRTLPTTNTEPKIANINCTYYRILKMLNMVQKRHLTFPELRLYKRKLPLGLHHMTGECH